MASQKATEKSMGDLLDSINEQEWFDISESEDTLALAEELLGMELGDREDTGVDAKKVYGALGRGLKQLKGSCSTAMARAFGRIQPLQRESAELNSKVAKLKDVRAYSLACMAGDLCRRLGAPEPLVVFAGTVQRAGGEGCGTPVVPEDLILRAASVCATVASVNALLAAVHAAAGPEGEPFLLPAGTDLRQFRDKDALGMCPGGKLHDSDLRSMVTRSLCLCDPCIQARKLEELDKAREKVDGQLAGYKASLREARAAKREAQRFLRGLCPVKEAWTDEHADPAFYLQVQSEEQQASQAVWDAVQRLAPSDLPLKLVFLDKSGSMGVDQVTYDALALATRNSLAPQRGSHLVFFFAGPGETQMCLRRPGDAVESWTLQLGCATWFNEPVVRALEAIAPRVDALEGPFREPPVQVLCVTDGMDNCSPNGLATLDQVVGAVRRIEGPSGKRLYQPMVGAKPFVEGRVPVWLVWMCLGCGGQQLLEQPADGVLLLDAVATPQFRQVAQPSAKPKEDAKADARAAKDKLAVCAEAQAGAAATANWAPGHRVLLPGRQAKPAVVLGVDDEELRVLLEDDQEQTVARSEVAGAVPFPKTLLRTKYGKARRGRHGLSARTAEPAEQYSQVLELTDQATSDLAPLMAHALAQHGRPLALEDCVAQSEGRDEVRLRLAEAQGLVRVEAEPAARTAIGPAALLKEAMQVVGQASARLGADDRPCAQRLVAAVAEFLVYGGAVAPEQVLDFAAFAQLVEAATRRRVPVSEDLMPSWQDQVAGPARALVALLVRKGVLHRCVPEDQRPLVATLWRFFDPSLSGADALKRCVDRYQRTRPALSTRLTGLPAPRRRTPPQAAENPLWVTRTEDADAGVDLGAELLLARLTRPRRTAPAPRVQQGLQGRRSMGSLVLPMLVA